MNKFLFFFLFLSSLSFAEGYNRDEFKVWNDSDKDCISTRNEILIRDSESKVLMKVGNCEVASGRWTDPYSLKVFLNPRGLDIDHIIPLKYAYDHGASKWTKEEKAKFGNDPENLFAVSASENRRKGDKGPFRYLPPNQEFQCTYFRKWRQIATSYQLSLEPLDASLISLRLKSCK